MGRPKKPYVKAGTAPAKVVPKAVKIKGNFSNQRSAPDDDGLEMIMDAKTNEDDDDDEGDDEVFDLDGDEDEEDDDDDDDDDDEVRCTWREKRSMTYNSKRLSKGMMKKYGQRPYDTP